MNVKLEKISGVGVVYKIIKDRRDSYYYLHFHLYFYLLLLVILFLMIK